MKKSLIAALAAAVTLFASATAFAGSEGITVIVDGATLSFDVAPQIMNDRTMVPMRAIFEALDAEVDWDGDAKKITSNREDTVIEMTIDDTVMRVNDEEITLDAAPTIVGDRTLVPVRAIADSLGADVEWYADTQTVLVLDKEKDAVVKANIEVKDYGSIDLLLFKNTAPVTVENFEKLANDSFYDNLIFHRVIKDFMIQGGGYDDSFTEKEAEAIKGEFTSNGVTNNLSHTRGVISMARTDEPDSASSQFFIVHKDSTFLDEQYASFGIVTSGMDAVDKIAETNTGMISQLGMTDVPEYPIYIQSVTIQ